MVIGSRGLPGLVARAPVGMVRWQEHVTVTRNRPTRVRVSLQRNIPVTMPNVVSQTVVHLSLALPQVPWDWIMFFKIIHSKGKFNVYSEFFFLTFILNQIFVCNMKGFFAPKQSIIFLKIYMYIYIKSDTKRQKKCMLLIMVINLCFKLSKIIDINVYIYICVCV